MKRIAVSILVILDVALKPGRRPPGVPADEVSILVILDVALKPCRGTVMVSLRIWFQSLLSWMLLSNPILAPVSPGGPCSFQSLLSWMLLSNIGTVLRSPGTKRFQSLLSWMLLSNRLSFNCWMLLSRSFNPCYPGCCSQTRRLLAEPVFQQMFQSLLSWMLLSNRKGLGGWTGKKKVSILVILDVALKQRISSKAGFRERSFNPCYPGCCSQTGP